MIFVGTELPQNEKIFTLVNLALADVLDSNIRLKPQMFDYLTDEERAKQARGLGLFEDKRAEQIKSALQTLCSLGIENGWTDETPLTEIIGSLQNDGKPIMELHEVINELNQ